MPPMQQRLLVDVSGLKDKGMSTKDVASVVSEITGMNKKEAYNAAMKLKDGK